jgi:cell wall-associated NlpC family hydrolase
VRANRRSSAALIAGACLVGATATGAVFAVLLVLIGGVSARVLCSSAAGSSGSADTIVLGPAGSGQTVGATEYGGPGDPSSGTVGSSGISLLAEPDSYAELGGLTFATATAMGGLPYGTALRITWGGHSVIAYKRDIGLGGAPIDGHPRVIDLWWELASRLGIPYENGQWSGLVRIERPPATGAGNLLGDDAALADASPSATATSQADFTVDGPVAEGATANSGACEGSLGSSAGVVSLTPGPRATLLSDGLAAAPADAPAAVKGMIAAGNQIVGKPYVYGGGHGLPLSEVAQSYDCSSSVAHLLYGGGLLAVGSDMTSAEFESWGEPGPGRWVTIYASADHVFMYVAGLRWDTHNAAGADDGTTGIGWHPLVREADGFVVRHPAGL